MSDAPGDPLLLACLRMAYVAHEIGDWGEYDGLYADACARFGAQAVQGTFDVLVRKGYLEPGALPGRLTDQGLEALTRLRDSEGGP